MSSVIGKWLTGGNSVAAYAGFAEANVRVYRDSGKQGICDNRHFFSLTLL